MRRTWKVPRAAARATLAALTVIALVAGLSTPAPVGNAGAAVAQASGPWVTVTPSTDLVDGQAMTVDGTGFPVDSFVRIALCPAAASSLDACGRSEHSVLVEDGTFSTEVSARAVLRVDGTDHDCRQPQACALGVGVESEDGAGDITWVPLHFAPDGPLLPPPTITVSPAEGLADGQSVTVAGTGFVRERAGYLMQCRAGPAITWNDCDGETSSFFDVTDGAFEVEHTMVAVLVTSNGTVDCRESGRCALVATSDLADPAVTAAAPTTFDPDAPLLDPPTLAVTPASDLVDGQVVQVEGQGFRRPGELVGIYQCAATVDWDHCRPRGPGQHEVGEDGSFSSEVPVTIRIPTPEGQVDCRTSPDPCLLVATTGRPESPRAARAELHFDPDAPLLPDPELSVTPATDLHDFTDLRITGRHFTPGGQVTVQVCQADDHDRCDGENAEAPTAAADGNLTNRLGGWATFPVRWWGSSDVVDCRRPPGCVVVATDDVRGVSATAPLAFGPPDAPRGRYLDPVFDEVQVDHDVVYRETVDHRGNPVELKMDVYRPAGDTATSRPAVVWMHGGWFISGDKSAMADLATDVAERGYVGVSLQYRLRPDMSTDDLESLYYAAIDAYDDATAAVEWLQAHAAEYGIDPDAIAAGGFSAGGTTSLNLAYQPGQRGPATSLIAAALPIAGLNMARPDPGEAPSILFHSTADTVLPANNGDTVCPAVEPLGIACELVAYDGANHELRHRDTVRRGTDFVVEQVLRPAGYFDMTADAGGAYEVTEGSTIALAGSASAGDDDDAPATYAWSPAERLDDPASPTATYTGHDDATETLTLTVTSTHGIPASDTAEVTTTNAAPTIDELTLVPAAAAGSPPSATGVTGAAAVGQLPSTRPPATAALTLDATVSDPGRADTHAATVDWGDGSVEAVAVEQGAGAATVHATHEYAEPGRYEVTLTVTDDDGGSDGRSDAAVAGCTVVGTDGDDELSGTGHDDVLCGLGGADRIEGAGGDDRVYGGDGHDRLLGGRGRDRADGGPGRDRCQAEIRRSCRPARPGGW